MGLDAREFLGLTLADFLKSCEILSKKFKNGPWGPQGGPMGSHNMFIFCHRRTEKRRDVIDMLRYAVILYHLKIPFSKKKLGAPTRALLRTT